MPIPRRGFRGDAPRFHHRRAALRLGNIGVHHIGGGQQNMVAAEAEIDMQEVAQRPQEQARAHQQHQGERHLGGDQRPCPC